MVSSSVYTNALSHRHCFVHEFETASQSEFETESMRFGSVYTELFRECLGHADLLPISGQNSISIQTNAASAFTRQMNPYPFQNALLSAAFSNRTGFGNSLDRRRVNRRPNRLEDNAATNETTFV